MNPSLASSVQRARSRTSDLMEESLQDNGELESDTPMVNLLHARCLADGIFALDEPWRGRFIELIARRARGWDDLAHMPTRAEIARWLCEPRLYNLIRLMLKSWNHEL
ncbi:MAG: hypothetical protein ACP5HG_16700 [Anaerolineae bacterium]